ncbi:hypothetical protein ElyMa_000321300 [Elysia marginata]|uniref:Uncharacterized protein n=1 Tax=Elysia marginata TaxID=1093978 RepID=A0AAV4FCP4_9GAST|nr:hypothetical protein ElyMa_000321300 [Elysia marginata]
MFKATLRRIRAGIVFPSEVFSENSDFNDDFNDRGSCVDVEPLNGSSPSIQQRELDIRLGGAQPVSIKVASSRLSSPPPPLPPIQPSFHKGSNNEITIHTTTTTRQPTGKKTTQEKLGLLSQRKGEIQTFRGK